MAADVSNSDSGCEHFFIGSDFESEVDCGQHDALVYRQTRKWQQAVYDRRRSLRRLQRRCDAGFSAGLSLPASATASTLASAPASTLASAPAPRGDRHRLRRLRRRCSGATAAARAEDLTVTGLSAGEGPVLCLDTPELCAEGVPVFDVPRHGDDILAWYLLGVTMMIARMQEKASDFARGVVSDLGPRKDGSGSYRRIFDLSLLLLTLAVTLGMSSFFLRWAGMLGESDVTGSDSNVSLEIVAWLYPVVMPAATEWFYIAMDIGLCAGVVAREPMNCDECETDAIQCDADIALGMRFLVDSPGLAGDPGAAADLTDALGVELVVELVLDKRYGVLAGGGPRMGGVRRRVPGALPSGRPPDVLWHALPSESGLPMVGVHECKGEELADTVNWVAAGAVTPVKDQGRCGSCCAVSSSGGLEGSSSWRSC